MIYDLAIIGGGITGLAVAREAAGRGLSVYLCEEGDLAAEASSATNRVVHGSVGAIEGVRFGAIREAVAEREILLHSAPHLVRPVEFILPHHQRLLSPRALRFRLFLFDHAARTVLPASRKLDLDQESAVRLGLKPHFRLAFGAYDCVVDDTRLAILNAVDARTRGASINPRVRCTVADRDGDQWRLSLESMLTEERFTVLARVLVNAAGARAGEVLNHLVQGGGRARFDYTKSVSIVVRRENAGRVGFALPTADGRVVHVTPFPSGHLTIGAVEGPCDGEVTADKEDILNLADVAGQYLDAPIARSEVVDVLTVVRARNASGHSVSVDAPPRLAPVVTVCGSGLPAHRRLAEEAVDRISRFRPAGRPWTAGATLPGGGFPPEGRVDLTRALRAAYPFVDDRHARRLVMAYGTRASTVISGARRSEDLGRVFGVDLTEAEVRYLVQEEWAMTADDILWRRTKLGYAFTRPEADALADFMASTPLGA